MQKMLAHAFDSTPGNPFGFLTQIWASVGRRKPTSGKATDNERREMREARSEHFGTAPPGRDRTQAAAVRGEYFAPPSLIRLLAWIEIKGKTSQGPKQPEAELPSTFQL